MNDVEFVKLSIQDLNHKTYFVYEKCLRSQLSDDCVFLVDHDVPVVWDGSGNAVAIADRITIFKFLLRENFRLKHGCDYTLMHKYGKNIVTTDEAYQDTIRGQAEEMGIEIEKWFVC